MYALFHCLSLVFMILALSACGQTMKINDFASTQPTLIPEEYFAGYMKAWGLFQDRSGAVKRQFVVDINSSWDGEKLTLIEDFTYDDGETEQRTWVLNKVSENRYVGTAGNVVGQAVIETAGNAMNLRYTFDLKAGDRTYRVDFDDWMFLQPDGKRMINRATVSKFGIRVGEVTVFFDKSADAIQAPSSVQLMQAAE